jgi:putative NADH-flavin reductase
MTMPTYAVFGATGNCGSSLIEVLLPSPDVTIHAYCRSEAKLARMFPDAIDSGRIKVFEGQIDNVDLFAQCVRGCRALFLAVTMNDNIPKVRVAQDMTHTLLAALKKVRVEKGMSMPKVVVLSSASLEPGLCRNFPKVMHWIVLHANSNVYEDLRVQERLLRAEEDWLTSIFIKPGGLVKDERRGHKLNMEDQETFVSYLDLAAGMIEAAEDPDNRYDMKDVSVNNVAGSAKFNRTLPLLAFCGVLRHYFPWLHPFLPMLG